MQLNTFVLALAATFIAAPATAREICPAALVRDMAAEAPACRLVAKGRLNSARGNEAVAWRLYRWMSTLEEPSGLEDEPPYNQNAVTLSLAARPGDPPFFEAHYWMDVAWFEPPYLATNPDYGEILVVPGRYAGTGGFIEDRVFLPDDAKRWIEIGGGVNAENGTGWPDGLKAYLPPGHGLWKGILVDYATLTGVTAVWREGDANCCPSGGEIAFRLHIAGPEPHLEVAEAQYVPQ